VETLWQVLEREPPPPRQLNPAVPRDLETICVRCLDKRPAHRYPSAAALAEDLERWVEGKPIRARRVRWPERAWLWCRRRPAIAALSAAAVLLITLAGAMYCAFGLKVGDLTAEGKEKQDRINAAAYLKDMRRAQKHIAGGQLTQARELLAKWRKEEGKTELRAWEWYFLQAQLRDAGFSGPGEKSETPAPGFSQLGHGGPVLAVAWSPDGTRLASADGQGSVKVWDVAANKELRQLTTGGGGVTALAWNQDSKCVAAAYQGTVKIWDVVSGKTVRTLHQAADINRPSGMPLPPGAGQEDLAASRSRDVLLGSWSASLFWNPSNQKLALADEDGKVQVWDLSTKKTAPLVLRAHKGGVHSAAWSPNGSRLASVSGDGLVKIWDPATDKPIKTIDEPIDKVPVRAADNKNPIPTTSYALAWTEDGKCMNVVSSDGEIQVVDVGSKKVTPSSKLVPRDRLAEIGVGRLGSHQERFIWSPDGKRLVSIQMGGVVKVWDPATGKEGTSTVAPGAKMMSTGMCSPAWDRSGRRLALGGSDGTVLAWPVPQARQPARRPVRELAIPGLALSADSRHLLGQRDLMQDNLDDHKAQIDAMRKDFMKPPPVLDRKFRRRIAVYDAISGEVVRRLGNDARGALDDVLAESPPDGKWVAAATSASPLQLWPAAGGGPVTLEKPAEAAGLPGGPPNNAVVLSWSPDGKRLAFSTSRQTTIRLWDLAKTDHPAQTLKGHGAPLRSLAWNRDGTRLASAAANGTVKVWDVSSGKEVSNFSYFVKQQSNSGMPKPRYPSTLSLSPDGKRLAVAGEDEIVRILDVDTREEIKSLHGHPSHYDIHDAVCAVAWSPDGKRLASASPDGTFLLWDTATWEEVLVLGQRPHVGMINPQGTLAWSPDGRQLAHFGYVLHTSSVIIWDATPEEGK
jgi:WD40 repeat protein